VEYPFDKALDKCPALDQSLALTYLKANRNVLQIMCGSSNMMGHMHMMMVFMHASATFTHIIKMIMLIALTPI
jgi:hypothetical protein